MNNAPLLALQFVDLLERQGRRSRRVLGLRLRWRGRAVAVRSTRERVVVGNTGIG
ncbi:MAG: hypothetical protein ABW318_02105 [Vicinamibacterales bacterium]